MQTIHRGEFGHIFRPWKKAAQRRASMDQPAEKDEVQNHPKTIPFDMFDRFDSLHLW